ncbi:hypothetical protein BADSM9389_02640 [Buttiauxella agrestis]|nr:hypothetical protein BADSM9389_02640 [Buttiauxella agrestis]
MSFGSYSLVSLAEAREKRDAARKQVGNGIDPVEELKAQKLAQQLSTETLSRLSAENGIPTKLTAGLWPTGKKSLRPLSRMFSLT